MELIAQHLLSQQGKICATMLPTHTACGTFLNNE